MHQNQQGSRWFSHRLCRETHSRPQEYLHFILFACTRIYIFTYVKVCKHPDGGGHSERALLLPRVYLQTVTLMQCNDYFYSRYFGSPFALSGMTPHWHTDYLCDCCHTWLLQLSSLSTITPSEPSPFLLLHLHLFIPPSLSVYLYPSSTFNSGLHLQFLWSLSLLQHLYHSQPRLFLLFLPSIITPLLCYLS